MEQRTTKGVEKKALPPIVIKKLVKSYGERAVIRDLSLYVKPGESLGFIGRNATGKSTTIGCLTGLRDFESGEIWVNGHNIKKSPIKAKVSFGYVPSEPLLYEMMTGREYLVFIAGAFKMKKERFERNLKSLLARFEFRPSDLERRIAEYSLGMRQKMSLMGSLIHEPKVWILDEPTVGLDPIAYEALVKTIRIFRKEGRSVFITSHSIDFVNRVCDRVIILKDGKIGAELDFTKDPTARERLGTIYGNLRGEKL